MQVAEEEFQSGSPNTVHQELYNTLSSQRAVCGVLGPQTPEMDELVEV